MCEGHSDVVVDAPAFLVLEGRKTVAVDGCIAGLLQRLWEDGIVTLSSCCGHGVGAPSLVLGDHQNPSTVREALSADDRDWELYQWQLVNVTPPHSDDEAVNP